jgi:hypothetical protein
MGSKLSSLLVQDKLVPVKTLEEAFALQAILGGQLDTILLEKKLVSEDDLVSVTCRATGIPAATPEHFKHLSTSLAEYVALDTARKLTICPVAVDSKNLTLLVSESTDPFALEDLAFELERKIHPFVTSEPRILQAQHEVYGASLEARFSRLLERLGPLPPLVDVTPVEAEVSIVASPPPRAAAAPPAEKAEVAVLEPLESPTAETDPTAEAAEAAPAAETGQTVEMDAELPVEPPAQEPDESGPPARASGEMAAMGQPAREHEDLPKVMIDPELQADTTAAPVEQPPVAADSVIAEMPPIPDEARERGLEGLTQLTSDDLEPDRWDEATDPSGTPAGIAEPPETAEEPTPAETPDEFAEDTDPEVRPAVREEEEEEEEEEDIVPPLTSEMVLEAELPPPIAAMSGAKPAAEEAPAEAEEAEEQDVREEEPGAPSLSEEQLEEDEESVDEEPTPEEPPAHPPMVVQDYAIDYHEPVHRAVDEEPTPTERPVPSVIVDDQLVPEKDTPPGTGPSFAPESEQPVDEEPTPDERPAPSVVVDHAAGDEDEAVDEEPTPADQPDRVIVEEPLTAAAYTAEEPEEPPAEAEPAAAEPELAEPELAAAEAEPAAVEAEPAAAEAEPALAEPAPQPAEPAAPQPAEPPASPPPEALEPELREALEKIRATESRDELLLTLAKAIRNFELDGVKIYVVKGNLLVGHMELGLTSNARDDIQHQPPLSLEIPTVLARSVDSGNLYIGPTPDTDASASVLAAAGVLHPRGLVLVPLVLKKKTICLLVGYSQGRSIPSPVRSQLAVLARDAAVALAELIVRLKAKKTRAAPAEEDHYTGDEERAPEGADDAPRRHVISDISAPVAPIEPATERREPYKGPPADLITLLRALEEGGPETLAAEKQIQALGKDAVQSLIAWFPGRLQFNRHTSSGVLPPVGECSAVLRALVAIGRPVLSSIAPLLLHPDTEVRFFATYLTSELIYPEAVALLARQLSDPSQEVRRIAIRVLRQFRRMTQYPKVLADLRNDLTNRDPRPRRGATEALGALGDEGAVSALIGLLHDDSDPVVAHAAQVALINITKQDYGKNTEGWNEWWSRNKGRDRMEWVIDGLVHEDPAIRASAAAELEELTSKSFGYSYDMPRRDREAIRRRFLEWLTLSKQQPEETI